MQPAGSLSCPPHHWFVQESPSGGQLWTCYRCGLTQHQLHPWEDTRLRS
jgi:hypothetical protein